MLHGADALFVHGDINATEKLVARGLFHCAVAAGVHCQPFSRMGDAKGMNDCRSQSLPKALATSWILQVVMIVHARCWFPRGREAVFIADRVPA